MKGGRRGGERGAESLEFLGLFPLFIIVIYLAWQGLILLQQTSEAQDDARALARAWAICGSAVKHPGLADIDPSAPAGSSQQVTVSSGLVAVRVTLPSYTVLHTLDLRAAGFPQPSARVTMRQEPC